MADRTGRYELKTQCSPSPERRSRPPGDGAYSLAQRAGVPPLRLCEALRDQEGRSLSLWQCRVPQGLHGDARLRDGALAYSAAQVVPGLLPALLVHEGMQLKADRAHP